MNDSDPLVPSKANMSPSRLEQILVLLLCLTAAALRSAYPSRLAVEHFDEGVYASNYFFSGDKGDEHYPSQHLYAPPLVPVLIEWTMTITGPSNLAAAILGIVAGSLTVPLIWWVGRCWFGTAAGLTAAAVMGFSDVHILYSRTSLTDVLLCFFLLAAVHFFWSAQSSKRLSSLVGAGVSTGLAWWTKYSGWLPLAIGIAGLLAWQLSLVLMSWQSLRKDRNQRRSALRGLILALLIWGGIAGLALAIWGPYWWNLKPLGGYEAVSSNHRQYLVGFGQWSAMLSAQAQKLARMSGPLTACAPLTALVLSVAWLKRSESRFTWNGLFRDRQLALVLPVVALIGAIEGGALITACLGGMGVLVALGRATSKESIAADSSGRNLLAPWILAAWLAGLLLTVPMYKSYPRLMLPLLLATWLGCGALMEAVISGLRSAWDESDHLATGTKRSSKHQSKAPARSARQSRMRPILIAIVAIGFVVIGWQKSPWNRPSVAWPIRTELAQQIPEIRDDLIRFAGLKPQPNHDGLVVYTYAEPALMFQLRLAGLAFVKPVSDLKFAGPERAQPRIPSFIAFAHQAERTPGFGEQLAQALPRLQLVGKYRYHPSDLVVLDGPLIRSDRPAEDEIQVYFLK